MNRSTKINSKPTQSMNIRENVYVRYKSVQSINQSINQDIASVPREVVVGEIQALQTL
jgi:hypothetical protein